MYMVLNITTHSFPRLRSIDTSINNVNKHIYTYTLGGERPRRDVACAKLVSPSTFLWDIHPHEESHYMCYSWCQHMISIWGYQLCDFQFHLPVAGWETLKFLMWMHGAQWPILKGHSILFQTKTAYHPPADLPFEGSLYLALSSIASQHVTMFSLRQFLSQWDLKLGTLDLRLF